MSEVWPITIAEIWEQVEANRQLAAELAVKLRDYHDVRCTFGGLCTVCQILARPDVQALLGTEPQPKEGSK